MAITNADPRIIALYEVFRKGQPLSDTLIPHSPRIETTIETYCNLEGLNAREQVEKFIRTGHSDRVFINALLSEGFSTNLLLILLELMEVLEEIRAAEDALAETT